MDADDVFPVLPGGLESPPYNISAFRLLFIYRLLAQYGQLSFQELNDRLLAHPRIERVFTVETLQKYIYTLRRFGCHITRYEENDAVLYRLDAHPLKPVTTGPELEAARRIASSLSQRPLCEIYPRFRQLFHRMTTAAATGDGTDALDEGPLPPDLSRSAHPELVRFQSYCADGQVLELRYKREGDEIPEPQLVEPTEVVYVRRRFYLIGNCPRSQRKVRFELDRIISHRQLPSRVRAQAVRLNVTFRLTGRLMRNYRPYPGESTVIDSDSLVVIHRTDDVEPLLRRLLKYGPLCEVLSPASAREEMASQVDNLLMAVEAGPKNDEAVTDLPQDLLSQWLRGVIS